MLADLEANGFTGRRLISAVTELTGLPPSQARDVIAVERSGDLVTVCCGRLFRDDDLVRRLLADRTRSPA